MASRLTLIIVSCIALLAIIWFGYGVYTWVVRNQVSYQLGLLPDGRIATFEATSTNSEMKTGANSSAEPEASPFSVASIAKDLVVPIGVVPLSGGRILIAERSGGLLLVYPDQTVIKLGTIPGVIVGGELGVVGIAGVSAIVADQPQVYALFTYRETNGELFNKVSKLTITGGVGTSTAGSRITEDILLDRIPTSSSNNSGAITVGPDGMVWVLTGDAGRAVLVQDPLSTAGKVLRLLPSGQIPSGNPTAGSPVYALGLRRPMGITWNNKGQGFLIDSGNGGYDEINKLVAGGNYGWPVVGGCWSEDRNLFVDPVICSGKGSWSPSGLDWQMATNSQDILVMSGLGSRSLYEVTLPQATTTGSMVKLILSNVYGRLRSGVVLGGDIWVMTSNRDTGSSSKLGDDQVLRLTPTQN